MVVSVVLNTEYMKTEERFKWFLKNVSFARNNDVLIVTHECLKKNMTELVSGVAERFYDEFEMCKISPEEIQKINICYIPDILFEKIYEKKKSQTQWILELSNHRNEEMENYVIARIDEELRKRGEEKPEYIQNCLHVFESIRYIAKYYDCPLIPYVFSAVRKVHGYMQTLYMANFADDLFCTDAVKKMYWEYETHTPDFPVLTKKEILALLGKKRNLPLLPLLNSKGTYEMGVILEGFHMIPQTFQIDGVTDDDLYFESKRYYTESDIISRVHPLRMDQMGATRAYTRNDPATFILNCKRLATVQSQMILKVAMWNRVPCVLGDSLPYAFLFRKDFRSELPVSDEDLNFILFCCMVPDSLMFDRKYWKWRMKNPSPCELMLKHLHEILSNLGYEESILFAQENRLEKILAGRGCTTREIELVTRNGSMENMDGDYLTSRLQVKMGSGSTKDYYCLNQRESDGALYSCFFVESEETVSECKLLLLDDVAGFVQVEKVLVDGVEVNMESKMQFCPKGTSKNIVPMIGKDKQYFKMEIFWKSKRVEDELC